MRPKQVRAYVILRPISSHARTLVEPSSHIDNEYSRAGILDPKIVVTTSRDPSSKLLQFAKVCLVHSVPLRIQSCYSAMQEMRLVFPGSHRINRGNYVVKELAEACRANDVSDLVILHEHRGVPGTSTHFVATISPLSISALY